MKITRHCSHSKNKKCTALKINTSKAKIDIFWKKNDETDRSRKEKFKKTDVNFIPWGNRTITHTQFGSTTSSCKLWQCPILKKIPYWWFKVPSNWIITMKQGITLSMNRFVLVWKHFQIWFDHWRNIWIPFMANLISTAQTNFELLKWPVWGNFLSEKCYCYRVGQ